MKRPQNLCEFVIDCTHEPALRVMQMPCPSLVVRIAWAFGLALCLLLSPAMAQVAGAPAIFQEGTSGDAVCTRCHGPADKKPILSVHQTRHGVASQPGCQACHGSSRAHVQYTSSTEPRPGADYAFSGPGRSSADLQTRTCLNCHKGGNRDHWPGSAHASADVTCAACHTIHQPRDKALARDTQRDVCFACHQAQRAQSSYLSTHPVARGTVACSDCHNAHGSSGPAALVKNTVNDTCYVCHAGKRGPFLWEHPPASDDCGICHTPHGSNVAPLLKARAPWLCQSCHAGSGHTTPALSGRGLPPGAGGTAASAQLLLGACTNCHSAIHGSNHPSGPRFTR